MEEEEEGGFFDGILDGVYGALERFWCWLVNWSLDWLDWMLDLIAPLLPDIGGYWNELAPFIGYANHWIPIDAAITAGAGLIALRISLIAVRWIVAFIPALG